MAFSDRSLFFFCPSSKSLASCGGSTNFSRICRPTICLQHSHIRKGGQGQLHERRSLELMVTTRTSELYRQNSSNVFHLKSAFSIEVGFLSSDHFRSKWVTPFRKWPTGRRTRSVCSLFILSFRDSSPYYSLKVIPLQHPHTIPNFLPPIVFRSIPQKWNWRLSIFGEKVRKPWCM